MELICCLNGVKWHVLPLSLAGGAFDVYQQMKEEKVLYNCGMIFLKLSFFVGYILSFGLVRL